MNEELQGEHDQESGRGDDARAAQAIKPPTSSGERRTGSDRRLLNTVALLAVLVFAAPLAVMTLHYLITTVVPSQTKEQTAQQRVEQMIVGEWRLHTRLMGPKDGISELLVFESGDFIKVTTYPSYVSPGQSIILKYEGKWSVTDAGTVLLLTLESAPPAGRLQQGDVLEFYIANIESSEMTLNIGSHELGGPGWKGLQIWVK